MTSATLLSVQDICKSFGELRAVDRVRFEVRPGEILGFLGPNGAGKTTTLRMILAIIRPDAGEVLWDGGSGLDRRRIGYLPEERGLFEDAEVLEMLIYLGTLRGMDRTSARAESRTWLERLGLGERTNSKVNTLSKGNQQKVQFAGAILHRPALAILDEPFSGLDPLNQELFLDLIRELRAQQTAVLLSAHQLGLVERLCDRFYLIARGRGVLEGTLDQIRREAAQGAADVLVVDLRPSGEEMTMADREVVLRRLVPYPDCRVRAEREGILRLEVSLPEATDLGPLLTALSTRFAVRRVHMRPLSLHEIYLRSVHGEAEAAAEETRA